MWENVELPSQDTGAYCQARQRLPEKLLQQLLTRVAEGLQDKVTQEHLWCNRYVKVMDGSTLSMPDTAENQKADPQPSTQAPGCGFPIAKIGVLFSLATGAAIALFIDVLNTHDVKLARRLYEFLKPDDVLLGDRAFCSYADLVFVKNCQADAVFRKHQGRKQELRRGKIVGSHDKQVVWHKPKTCPKGLTQEEFATLPLTITVREVHYYIAIPGFCTQQVSLMTTLLDTQTYSTLDSVVVNILYSDFCVLIHQRYYGLIPNLRNVGWIFYSFLYQLLSSIGSPSFLRWLCFILFITLTEKLAQSFP